MTAYMASATQMGSSAETGTLKTPRSYGPTPYRSAYGQRFCRTRRQPLGGASLRAYQSPLRPGERTASR